MNSFLRTVDASAMASGATMPAAMTAAMIWQLHGVRRRAPSVARPVTANV